MRADFSIFVVLFLLAVSLSTPPAAAWESAPLFGADVRSLAIHPEDPDLVLAGTSGGQVYLSRDGGASWNDAGMRLPFIGWVVGSLLFDPNRSGRLWAGLWGVWGSGMILSSDDLGETWQPRSGGLPEEPVYSLAAVPGRPGHLYAGTAAGVYGTRDGGASWRPLTPEHPGIVHVSSLYVDPDLLDTVLAGTWRRAYRSDDGGLTWRGVFEGMVLDSQVFTLQPMPGRSGEIWASTCGWIYRTRDRGDRWTRFKQGLDERRVPSFAVLADGTLLAGTVTGVYASTDGGASWKRRTPPNLAVRAIAQHPARPERILLGTEGSGVWRSVDGGEGFSRASRGMTNVRVAALAVAGGEILAGLRHAGPASGVYGSRDGGRSWTRAAVEMPQVLALAVHEGRAFAGTEQGLFERTVDGEWRRVTELGERRVEQVLAGGGRLVARAADGLFELAGDRFQPVPYRHGQAQTAALVGPELWVGDGERLHRLTQDANDTVSAPFEGGSLDRLGGTLLLAGKKGLWQRTGGETPWGSLLTDPARLVATGDARYPFVTVIDDREARLLDREVGEWLALELFFPARDVTAAAVVGERLFLGTSGYGLVSAPLPAGAVPSPSLTAGSR